jgi:hypothetical protein
VEFVGSWLEIAVQSKHIYFVHFKMRVKLEFMRSEKIISNWYEVQRNLFTSVIREHIFANLGKNAIV